MILTDILELTPDTRWSKRKTKEHDGVKQALEIKDRFESIDPLLRHSDPKESKTLTGMKNRLKGLFNDTRASVLTSEFSLPSSLLANDESKDILTRAALSPKVGMSHLRDIADKLGFTIIPYQYLDERSYEDESPEMKGAIKGFASNLEQWYDIYVLAPIHHYDVHKHVTAQQDFPIYAGLPCAQAFMAISIAIPMFRTLTQSISQLREHTSEIASQVNKHKDELTNLARRVGELQAQVEKQRQQEIIRQQENKRLRERLAALESRSNFWAYEPVMVAVPKGTAVTADTIAIVGPCWGPDFEDIVLASIGLNQVENQRELLADKAKEWGPQSTPGLTTSAPFVGRIIPPGSVSVDRKDEGYYYARAQNS